MREFMKLVHFNVAIVCHFLLVVSSSRSLASREFVNEFHNENADLVLRSFLSTAHGMISNF